jgi:16S rRNA (uracil1498-N3)-methyltransferase
MPRFFVNKELIDGGKIYIKDGDAHHIARSLRMAEGDEVTVSDGEGKEFFCRLTRIRDEECECEILSEELSRAESPVDITLCMAYPKGDKLETVIQKAVELGVSRILPFESSRCIKRPKAEKIDKQLARLSKIAEEAAKQCGRAKIPEVLAPLGYREMLKYASGFEMTLFCYEAEEDSSVKNILKSRTRPATCAVIVGSEGGFSEDEVGEAILSGATVVTLGKRILRCETAPDYVLSAISYEYEL